MYDRWLIYEIWELQIQCSTYLYQEKESTGHIK